MRIRSHTSPPPLRAAVLLIIQLMPRHENNHTPGVAFLTGSTVGVVFSFALLRLPSETIRPGVLAKSLQTSSTLSFTSSAVAKTW